uniref:hypothetical protein n=1 Tax=Mesotoga sp. TaxID=2053577 RepID=UPI00345E6C34
RLGGLKEKSKTGLALKGSPFTGRTCYSFQSKDLFLVLGQTVYSESREKGKAMSASKDLGS